MVAFSDRKKEKRTQKKHATFAAKTFTMYSTTKNSYYALYNIAPSIRPTRIT